MMAALKSRPSSHAAAFGPSRPWKARADWLRADFQSALKAVDRSDRDLRIEPVRKGEIRAIWRAHYALVFCLDRRIGVLERQLTAALASDAFTDDMRTRIVRTLTGTTRSDAKLLNAHETHLLDCYHAIDQPGRTLLRLLLERLAATSGTGGAR